MCAALFLRLTMCVQTILHDYMTTSTYVYVCVDDGPLQQKIALQLHAICLHSESVWPKALVWASLGKPQPD